MLAVAAHSRFFVFQRPIDMRTGVEGLTVLAEEKYPGQLMKGNYFVFVSKRGEIVKVLYWDNDGFAMWWKRLVKGRFWLPETGKTEIERREFLMFLEGIVPKKFR
jgi:transposase